jgi:exodeoxyribonuclease VII large subunit
MQRILSNREERLDRSMMKRVWREPGILLQKQQDMLLETEKRLRRAMEGKIQEKSHHLALAAAGLDNLSPLKVMTRGYAILTKEERVVKDVNDVEIGDVLQADLANGRLQLVIKGKEKMKNGKYQF